MNSLIFTFLNREVLRVKDTGGRPLGEKVYPELYDSIYSKEKKCPYKDSRHMHDKLMNVSALNDIVKEFKEIIYIFERISCEIKKRDLTECGAYTDYWRAWVFTTYFPDFIYLKNIDTFKDGEMSVSAAGIYKVSVGFVNSTMPLMVKEMMGQALPTLTSENVYQHADETGELIQRDCAYKSGVCAGPPNLIIRAAEAMLVEEFELNEGFEQKLLGYIGSFDSYLGFAVNGYKLSMLVMLFLSELYQTQVSECGVTESDVKGFVDVEGLSQTAVIYNQEAYRIASLPESEFHKVKNAVLSSIGLDDIEAQKGADIQSTYMSLINLAYKDMLASISKESTYTEVSKEDMSGFWGKIPF